MKKQRIRIHKQTLHGLNDPQYIQLLVNPEKQILALKRSRKGDIQSHQVKYIKDHCCELYSKELLYQLSVVNPLMKSNRSYRIIGLLNEKLGLALFNLNEIEDIENTLPIGDVCEDHEK